MRITHDVIRDLLALQASGQASRDTEQLVESYLAEHPDLRAEARAAEAWTLPDAAGMRPDASVERRALRETKRRLRLRSFILAAAIFFTALPMSVYGNDDGLQWAFWSAHRGLAVASLALATGLWFAYVAAGRALRTKGF